MTKLCVLMCIGCWIGCASDGDNEDRATQDSLGRADPSLKGNLSYSHPWAASPAFLIPSDLFGIEPVDAGYARFRVAPRPGSLDRASVTVPTVRGTIGAAFDRAPGGSLRIAVRIPGNTSAEVRIPVPDSTTTVYVDRVPHAVAPENGYATLRGLRPGCRLVSAEPPSSRSGTDDAASILDVCRDTGREELPRDRGHPSAHRGKR